MFANSPEKFASAYETELGQRIWVFLTETENVAQLETASQLRKPAVEGIEEHLLHEFREDASVGDIWQLRHHVHVRGYQRVRIERLLRRA